MKNKLYFLLFLLLPALAFSQEEDGDEKKGFKKENLFTGGSLSVSFFNGTTVLGINPLFGYRLANWVDGGVVFNLTYTGVRDYFEFDDKLKQTIYGGGVFTRLYPVNFLFAQAQLEHNFIRLNYKPAAGSVSYNSFKETVEANSLLLGAGYTSGRQRGSNTFFYMAVLFDVLKNPNSPYVDVVINPNNGQRSIRNIPIIRAGVNIGLFENKN